MNRDLIEKLKIKISKSIFLNIEKKDKWISIIEKIPNEFLFKIDELFTQTAEKLKGKMSVIQDEKKIEKFKHDLQELEFWMNRKAIIEQEKYENEKEKADFLLNKLD